MLSILALGLCFASTAVGTLHRSSNFSALSSYMNHTDIYDSMNPTSLHDHHLSACNDLGAHRPCMVDVCFVFDGGSSVSRESFEAEKRFSFQVGVGIAHRDPHGKIGAVQFGTSVRQVVPLTTSDADFRRGVSRMQKLRGDRNINGGLTGCRLMLDETVTRRKVIVLMANGKADIGGSIDDQVRGFRELGGFVYIVATAKSNMDSVRRMKAERGKVYYVDSFENEAQMHSVTCDLGVSTCSTQ